MNEFYIIDINNLPDPASASSSMEDLPEERKEKCLRYRQINDRKRCLGAGKIINHILEQSSATLKNGPYGKPEADGIFFNISHSGRYVIGVSSDSRIGCDIEEMKDAPLKVADHYFHDSEKDYITTHDNSDIAFWILWTSKESYMKMTGEGMSLSLKSFEIDTLSNPMKVHREGIKQSCYLQQFIYDNHMISICSETEFVTKSEFVWL